MASCSKKARLVSADRDKRSIFERFPTESRESLKFAFETLCSSLTGGLGSFTIAHCNANIGRGIRGRPFRKAEVEINKEKDNIFCFGSIFLKGYELLQTYLEDPMSIPSDPCMEIILGKLLEFLIQEEDFSEFIKQLDDVSQECDLAVRFAEHFFSKLTTTSTYKLDQDYPGKTEMCRCCETDVDGHYNDTSIGNVKVWHGSLDIIFGNCNLGISVELKDKGSQGGNSAVEVKVDEDLEEPDVSSQILAQAIVFSFTQKKAHPNYRELSYLSILATWFVLNYEYLCTGCTDEILKDAEKATFFEHAGPFLPIYQNELTVGGVKREWKSSLYEKFIPSLMRCPKLGKLPKDFLLDKSGIKKTEDEKD